MREIVSIRSWVLGILLFCCSPLLHATINFQGVSTTASTCANNGSISVFAYSSPDPFLLYAIVAGPVTAPMQNSSYFPSLYPGTYTVRMYDINFDSLEVQATVGGNYSLPDLLPIDIDPTCMGAADGVIIGNADSTKGLLPFTWQMISPYFVGPQPVDTFSALYGGTYDIRMTDACGNYQTRTVVLNSQGTGLSNYYSSVPSVNF